MGSVGCAQCLDEHGGATRVPRFVPGRVHDDAFSHARHGWEMRQRRNHNAGRFWEGHSGRYAGVFIAEGIRGAFDTARPRRALLPRCRRGCQQLPNAPRLFVNSACCAEPKHALRKENINEYGLRQRLAYASSPSRHGCVEGTTVLLAAATHPPNKKRRL